MVPEELGHQAAQTLRVMGFDPGYSTYLIEHYVCAEEITAIAEWLKSWLATRAG